MKKLTGKRVAVLGIMLAAASIVFLIEGLIPPILPFAPYVKTGLANVFVLLVIVWFGNSYAFLFVLAKNLLTGLVSLSGFALIFNLAGSVCAYAVMALLYRWCVPKISLVSVSVAGAIFSNIARTAVAVILTEAPSLYVQLPFVSIFSVLAGITVGILTILCVKHLPERLTNIF